MQTPSLFDYMNNTQGIDIKALTYISLFSSAGIGCYGFKQQGFKCIATNEYLGQQDSRVRGQLLTREIKKIDSEQMVVLFSGSNDMEFLVEAINLGADKFFTKPLDFKQLKDHLESIATKITAQKQNEKYRQILQKKWGISHDNYKDLINEFEQHLELIDEANCIRKYDNEGNLSYINQK